MNRNGLEGTVLGTLVMPYCSGFGNLVFAFVLAKGGGKSSELLTNSIVNNATNLTLLLGLPCVFWGLSILPEAGQKKPKKKKWESGPHINRLSLLLNILAGLFFTGALWAVGRDGQINFGDGLILIGLFFFWQTFQVFDVLKSNVRQNTTFKPILLLDLAVLLLTAAATYLSVDWLVKWLSGIKSGFLSVENLGWLSGWLMVVPNAILAFYYAGTRRAEITYSSQVADGHICIPLCLGLFALFQPVLIPKIFDTGLLVISAGLAVHFVFIMVLGRLPRLFGAALVLSYGYFIYLGLF